MLCKSGLGEEALQTGLCVRGEKGRTIEKAGLCMVGEVSARLGCATYWRGRGRMMFDRGRIGTLGGIARVGGGVRIGSGNRKFWD